ncbi:MAG: hypothetical protein HQL89_14945 [Magnetococcales bacterium]|nr:hypothetical protein [Magnetococcales bacterium]
MLRRNQNGELFETGYTRSTILFSIGFLHRKTAHPGGLFAFKNPNVSNGWRRRFEYELGSVSDPPESEVAFSFSPCQYSPKALDSPPGESDKTGLTFPAKYQSLT